MHNCLPLKSHWLLSVFCTLVCFAFAVPNPGTANDNYWQISVTTTLDGIEKGSFDGREYLSVSIDGHSVGPSLCRSNTLRLDNNNQLVIERQASIESIALSAMIEHTSVKIVVPMDNSQCMDGKPTFTDLIPASQWEG